MKAYKKALFMFTIFALLFLVANPHHMQTQYALAADGANGEITAGFFNAQYETPLVFWVEGLDVDSDYGIGWGPSSTATTTSRMNFTTGGAQTTFTFTESFETTDTSSGDMLRVGLWPGGSSNSVSASANAIDYFELVFSDISESFPTGWFIALGVGLIIVLLVAGIVTGMIPMPGKKD